MVPSHHFSYEISGKKIQGYEAETCPNSSTLTLATSTDLHFMSSLSLESCHLAWRVF